MPIRSLASAVVVFAQLFLALPLRTVAESPSVSNTVTFEGRTPCGPLANEFTQFPSQDCEKIKWRLTLTRASGQPATYLYEGTRAKRNGRWRSTTSPTGRVIYHLEYEPKKILSLLSIDDEVLLLLREDLTVLRGDASWSYVLNRVERPMR